MRKIILSLSLLFAFVLFQNNQATAQNLKIGYVQVDSVASMMPAYKAASSELEGLQKVIQKNLQGESQKFQARQSELQQTAKTQAQQEQAQQELQALYAALQEKEKQAEERFNKKQNDLLFPIYEEIREAIKVVGSENNFVLILNELDGTNSSYILYSAEGTDVTDLVIKKLGL
ncbi:outer membrane protein [Bernardetia litoralis DSM 6794]|uniref:Outer membrane protein n=1 Tax=Bernardetia litoralis (strain ATCC 23117 / DSM 6794 / NBRC 15988 / NCIMB 1366 / Fx l1 / Sio-4) TaxID=880071 RepID=I4AJ32_BERLS|nr:OmpH family outer membrane protein [Bernardetia litoralis]AFM03967.1 outer membrane protein [Bernardetia litoralis DSM 6794]